MRFFSKIRKSDSGALTSSQQRDGINRTTGTDYVTTEIKTEILRWLYTMLCSLFFYSIIAVFVISVYHPDINALKEAASRVIVVQGLTYPKPVESLLFRLGIITLIPSLAGFYVLFCRMKWVKMLAQKFFLHVFSVTFFAALTVLVYFDFTALTMPGNGKRLPELAPGVTDTNFNFFFDGFFIGNYLWLYLLLVLPLFGCLFFLGIKKYRWDDKRIYRMAVSVLGYAVAGTVVAAIIAMNIFRYPYANDNMYDFNAVYYPMTQVYAGAPLLVAGFTDTYGLYPHFLNPLFQLIGLDILKFSIVMSIMLGISFVLNFYIIRKFTGNRIILFLGFSTMLFFSYLDRKMTTQFDCYFALFPIRYIIPSLLLWLSALHFSKPSRKLYWTTFFLMAVFVLWNPEIGIVCYFSWIIVNVYHDFYSGDGKINLKKIVSHLVAGICILPFVFYAYKLVIYLFYGVYPDLGLLWKTVFVFGKLGLMLLPMSLINPWNLFALVLLTGFLYAVVKWHKKAVTAKSSVVLLLSLIGLGYLVYYQGRSHNVTLSVSTGFCILLLTVLGDELWQITRSKNILPLNVFFAGFLFLISFSFIELFFDSGKIYAMVTQEENKDVSAKERELVDGNLAFILNNTQEGQKMLLLSSAKFQGIYFNGYKRLSAFNPGLVDLALRSDYDRLMAQIRDSSLNIFIEPTSFYFAYMQTAAAEVAALYEFKGAGISMALLNKRTALIPEKAFFKGSGDQVFYRKYNDDSAGLQYRINDAFGTSTIKLQSEFSVQVLFYSQVQVYPYASLTGNLDDTLGFEINNIFNSPDYLFSVGSASVKMPANYNTWNYVVMNVYPDHMDVTVNGETKSLILPQPFRNSDAKLYVGNLLNFKDYFVGAIAEVLVENKAVGQAQINETWKQIADAVKN